MAKQIQMMTLAHCPHCKRAFELMEELFLEHPEYREIPLAVIDEEEQPALADSLDYYYVPTFFVDGVKLHEGVPSMEAIRRVFEAAKK